MYSFRERAPQNRPKRRHFETVGRHLYFGNGSEADELTFDKLSLILYTKVLRMVHCVAVGRHKLSNTKGVSFIKIKRGAWVRSKMLFHCLFPVLVSHIEMNIASHKASQSQRGIPTNCHCHHVAFALGNCK